MNACRLRLEQNKEESFALERKVMNMQQENVSFKQSIRCTKRSVSKATTIFPSLVFNNYRGKYVTVVAALKRKVSCFKKTNISFNGKEIVSSIFALVKSGFIITSNEKVAAKVF